MLERLLPALIEGSCVTGVLPAAPDLAAGPAMSRRVSVVIPAKNEARNLAHVFGSIPPWVDQIVLVDGHSVDDTVAVARQLCPDVKIVDQVGWGKGDALRVGFDACDGEIIVMIDADGSTDGAEIGRFVEALLAGADFAKGSRFAAGGGSDDLTLMRRLGNNVLCALVNRMFGTRYTDLCYGYNAFWKRHLPAFDLDCDGFEVETVMNIRAAKAGLRIQEIPSHEHSRLHGVSNLNVVRDGWRIAKVIAAERPSAQRRSPSTPARVAASSIPELAATSIEVAELG